MMARPRGARQMRMLLAVLLAAAWLLQAEARAQGRFKAEAERRDRVAKKLYAQGRYDSALQMWQSAYDLHADPKYLFNVALAKEKIFDFEGCALAFLEFLRQTEQEEKHGAARESAQTRLETCLEKTVIPVRFTSVPTNAAVYTGEGEDKMLRGRTPQRLELPPGKHHITVTLQGYVPQEQLIEVAIGKRPQADFVLEKLSSLRIEVDPSGARVRLGDAEWQSAPMTREVKAGVHEVRVEKEGYEPAQRQVKVEAGQEVSLVLSLRPLPTIRTLTVSANARASADARVEVDGELAGTPPIEKRLSPGSHSIRVKAAGHLPYDSSITVPEDRDIRLLVTLQPKRSRQNRIVLWGLVGAASAAAIAGSAYGILALSDQAKFNDDKTDVGLHERGERRAERADLWLGTAAVLGAGAFLYYYLTRPGDSSGRIE